MVNSTLIITSPFNLNVDEEVGFICGPQAGLLLHLKLRYCLGTHAPDPLEVNIRGSIGGIRIELPASYDRDFLNEATGFRWIPCGNDTLTGYVPHSGTFPALDKEVRELLNWLARIDGFRGALGIDTSETRYISSLILNYRLNFLEVEVINFQGSQAVRQQVLRGFFPRIPQSRLEIENEEFSGRSWIKGSASDLLASIRSQRGAT